MVLTRGRSRWSWALGTVVAGALVGTAGAWVANYLRPRDAPEALDPDDVEAVVDRSVPSAPVPGAVPAS